MLIKILLAVICSVWSCTAWSKRELTEYEKLQIMARDYHFDYIQMVGYEERRPKINPRQKKRKRSGTGSRNDLERMLKRQLRHHQHHSHHHHRHHNRKVTVDWTRRFIQGFLTARNISKSGQRLNWWSASAADGPCEMRKVTNDVPQYTKWLHLIDILDFDSINNRKTSDFYISWFDLIKTLRSQQKISLCACRLQIVASSGLVQCNSPYTVNPYWQISKGPSHTEGRIGFNISYSDYERSEVYVTEKIAS